MFGILERRDGHLRSFNEDVAMSPNGLQDATYTLSVAWILLGGWFLSAFVILGLDLASS